MAGKLKLGDIVVDLVQKDIKNVHLSVYPPTGRVRISAPLHMSADNIRVFAIAKLGWIKKEQKKMREQERETQRDYVDRESHYVFGKRCLLKVIELEAPPCVSLKHKTLTLQVRPKTDLAKRREIVAQWYRSLIKEATPPLIAKWEPVLKVEVAQFFVQQMKTKWGSCNPTAGNIRLNSELAKKPPECLEYIVVHEMVHLLEPTHNERFVDLMDSFMPQWAEHRAALNRLPVRHERWRY
jgi:predicted metal-dependent hydrolase